MTDAPILTEEDGKEPLFHAGPIPDGLAEKALEVMRRTPPPRDYERENQWVVEGRQRRKARMA